MIVQDYDALYELLEWLSDKINWKYLSRNEHPKALELLEKI